MKKYVIIAVLAFFMGFGIMLVGAVANGGMTNKEWKAQEKRMEKIVNVQNFCRAQTAVITEQVQCVAWITNFRKKMSNNFRTLSAAQLKRIHKRLARRIENLRDKDSNHYKNLRDAVRGIGDTMRKPIEVPVGVRRSLQQMRQQRYIR